MAKLSRKRGNENDVNTMFDVKHLIEKSSNMINPESESDVKRIHSELDDLNKKFEELRDVVVGVKKEGESDRKKKVKREIVRLLQEKKRLNPTQLGKLLGLSRVRSNEYLREMEDDKIVKGLIIKKRKFYMLESGVTGKVPAK
jgi:hypothetical protein